MTEIDLHKDDIEIRTRLVHGPVDVDVSQCSKKWTRTTVIAYLWDGDYPFETKKYSWKYARLPRPKERRPWTAEEIMAHGVFEIHGDIVRTVGSTEDIVIIGESGRWNKASFINAARAVCLELRNGILCDTREREELYKEVE